MDDRTGTTAYKSDSNTIEIEPSASSLSFEQEQFMKDVQQGLTNSPKSLPCKYFYDQRGSELFEQICQLDEYYITRTELALLNKINTELAQMIGPQATIIEPGAGAGIKIQALLNSLDSPHSYVPMDISKDFLFYSANIIQSKFPDIQIMPIQGDFTHPVEWQGREKHHNRIVFFPGSTIGNFDKQSAIEFLNSMRSLVGSTGALIIGADLLKERYILESAYDDSKGVTAAFNKNILARINSELGGNFNLDNFSHRARLNQREQRIEMHLLSKIEQTVSIGSHRFSFASGESIHTENSHKYTIDSFLQMASAAGFRALKTWTDEDELFSVHYLVQNE